MENHTMSLVLNNDLTINATSYDALISYMESSNDYWYMKDNDSRYVYINGCAMHYASLPKNFNFEGKLDSECPAYWSDFADILQAFDKKVIDTKQPIPTLFNLMYDGKEKLIQSFVGEVTPLIINGKSAGVIGRGKKLEIYSMHHLAYNQCADVVSFGNPSELFSDREFDVVFYAIQSLSTKEIARRLNLSPNTVKKHLQTVYEKIGISFLNQLIEYCRSKGYDKYAPSRFLNTDIMVSLA